MFCLSRILKRTSSKLTRSKKESNVLKKVATPVKDPFDEAFNLIIGFEGGYSNDPNDPGGETKFGISKRAHPKLDIKNLTLDQAKEIYFRDYWQSAGCPGIPVKAHQIAVFDCAVNQGVGVARKLWSEVSQRSDALELFMALRVLRYVGTKNFDRYGKGWIKRLFKVLLVS